MAPTPQGTDLQPELDAAGLAQHGATWGQLNHLVLRATSRGPGVPVQVRHPLSGGPVRRVLSGDGTAFTRGGNLFVTPAAAAAGADFNVVVEL